MSVKPSWSIALEKINSGTPMNNTGKLPYFPMFLRIIEDEYFDPDKVQTWFHRYWHYSVYIAAIYLVLIYYGHRYMQSRKAFDLRTPLIIWSALLAVFSIFGAWRHIFGFVHLAKTHGFKGTLCSTHYYTSTPEGFWALLFVLSKVPELVDTFFIVARKKKLIFLHWYHHTTVMVFSFYLYRDRLAGGAYYGVMNFTVHAVMYSYYTLTAMRIRVPKPISMLVTTMQTAQMFVGVFVTCFLWTQLNNPDCPITFNNVLSASLMYSTYLYLFCEFFYNAYIAKKFVKKSVQTKKKE